VCSLLLVCCLHETATRVNNTYFQTRNGNGLAEGHTERKKNEKLTHML
jgi:hypothetical protein